MSGSSSQSSSVASELLSHGHVLGISCLIYLLLAGASTFVPAVIMPSVGEEFNLSSSSLSALSSAGSALKAGLIITLMGPLLDRIGPTVLINACILGSAVCACLLAACPNGYSYMAVFMILYVFNSFSEQPAFVVCFATHYNKALGIATTSIAAAFSGAGLVLPLALAPLLLSYGWRALWLALGLVTLLFLPVAMHTLKTGPISLKPIGVWPPPARTLWHAAAWAIRFGLRVSHGSAAHQHLEDSFTGGRLSGSRARRASAVDTISVLAALERHDALLSSDGDDHWHDEPPPPPPPPPPPQPPQQLQKQMKQEQSLPPPQQAQPPHSARQGIPHSPAAASSASTSTAAAECAADDTRPSPPAPRSPSRARNVPVGEAVRTGKFGRWCCRR